MPKKPTYPGIEERKDGYRVRATGRDPRTGKRKEMTKWLPKATLAEAIDAHRQLCADIASGGRPKVEQETLTAYARSWLERKVVTRRLRSDLTKERYLESLEKHILPELGDLYVAAITKLDLENWLAKKAGAKYEREGKPAKKYAAHTINGWWRVLKELLQSAVVDLDLARDPTMKVVPLPTDPVKGNTLTADELDTFIEVAQREQPQWYAMLLLGFCIGARPGELRPLRWGEDFDPATGRLTLQRSQRRKWLGPTKTRVVREVYLPKKLVDVLLWHRRYLRATKHPGAESPLLFPSMRGTRRPPKLKPKDEAPEVAAAKAGTRAYFREYRRKARARKRAAKGQPPSEQRVTFISANALDKPMREIAAAAGIKGTITPKAMRRSFNDLARQAQVHDLVIRATTGHRTAEMQAHYSTIGGEETRAGVAKVISLFGGRALVPGGHAPGGASAGAPEAAPAAATAS